MKNLILAIVFLMACSLNFTHAGTITGKVTHGKKKVSGAVIYISGNYGSAPGNHAKMNQKNLSFSPHVLPVMAGTTVDFLNSDDVLHNVFTSDGCAENFNLGSWPKGETRSYTFNNVGCVATILCNVHPEMEAYIVVVGNPYFTVSSSGSYKIKNVPAGTYTLKIWHEKYQGSDISVTVGDGEVSADFDL